MKHLFSILFLILFSCGARRAYAQTPLNSLGDSYFSSGVIVNTGSPFLPGPYASAGTMVTSATAMMPVYVGVRYELYRDITGRPAYAGFATAKFLLHRWPVGKTGTKSIFLFADADFGGAGAATGLSSALAGEGGAGYQFAKHWAAVGEYDVRRIPALTGQSKAIALGVVYNFNKPK